MCPNAPQKTRIINNVNNNVENLVSRNLYDSFNNCLNIPCTPIKVRVQVVRNYTEPVNLLREFNSVRDAPGAPTKINRIMNRDHIEPVILFR